MTAYDPNDDPTLDPTYDMHRGYRHLGGSIYEVDLLLDERFATPRDLNREIRLRTTRETLTVTYSYAVGSEGHGHFGGDVRTMVWAPDAPEAQEAAYRSALALPEMESRDLLNLAGFHDAREVEDREATARVTDVQPPKLPRGRPRVHADAHAARQAARDRATAHTQARRLARPERTISLIPDRVAQGESIISSRGLDGWSHLVSVLLEDEVRRCDGEL